MSERNNGKKENPYLILCPCCGGMICFKCAQWSDRFNGLCPCEDCTKAERRWKHAYNTHLEIYDHEDLDKASHVAIFRVG